MKKFITISIFTAVLFGALAVAHINPIFAQEEQERETMPPGVNTEELAKRIRSVTVAQVDILGTNIQKVSDTNYGVTFSLKSSDVVTQNAFYRIVLLDSDGAPVYVLGNKNSVELPPGDTTVENAKLVPPQGLEGTVTVMVYVTNADGLPLATGNAGQITLAGETSGTASIEECVADKSSYEPLAPVTITCELMGKIPTNATIIGTAFASRSSKPAEAVTTEISKNSVTYSFATLANPGNYTIVSQLFARDIPQGVSVLTDVNISGNIANITNVILDKASYQVGETAKVTAALSISGFEKGQLFVTATLKTNEGALCAEMVSKELEAPNSIEVDIPVTVACDAPTIELTLEDKEGNLFDVGASSVPLPAVVETDAIPISFSPGEMPIMVFVSIGFALILLAVLGVRKLLADRNAVVNESINQ